MRVVLKLWRKLVMALLPFLSVVGLVPKAGLRDICQKGDRARYATIAGLAVTEV